MYPQGRFPGDTTLTRHLNPTGSNGLFKLSTTSAGLVQRRKEDIGTLLPLGMRPRFFVSYIIGDPHCRYAFSISLDPALSLLA